MTLDDLKKIKETLREPLWYDEVYVSAECFKELQNQGWIAGLTRVVKISLNPFLTKGRTVQFKDRKIIGINFKKFECTMDILPSLKIEPTPTTDADMFYARFRGDWL